jgi:hypothetical protein
MSHHDVYAQFIYVLSRGAPRGPKPYLLPEDFVAMVQDIVDTHPGLAFLREAQEFHFRYVRTVRSMKRHGSTKRSIQYMSHGLRMRR